jgi:hypothetical protein
MLATNGFWLKKNKKNILCASLTIFAMLLNDVLIAFAIHSILVIDVEGVSYI